MHHSQINTRYAKSLFLLAEEKNQLDKIKRDIDLILQWFEDNEDVNTLFDHPIIKSSKKAEILTKIFKNQVSEDTLSFLHLVVKNKRENHLKHICNYFIVLYKKARGIRTAVLTTSFELTRTHKESVKKSIESTFKSSIELQTKVNESVLGGLIIQVDDKQLDLSVSRQIQELRNQFINIDFNKNKNK
ncbi:MAG: ATP synthase F1 subunit delta [Marinilabiliales bacterium]|nr:MAG: ATP synthase F1 subunit delta [Marinilabiliales bacterium]